MEKATKKCPCCGEEILEVAKKCKHCGEWLEPHDGPAASGYNSLLDMFKKADYSRMLPVTTVVFCLTTWMGIYPYLWLLSNGFCRELYYEMPAFCFYALEFILTFCLALAIVLFAVHRGVKKCNYFTSPAQTVATLRKWLALEIGLASWPVFIIIGCVLVQLSIIDDITGYYYIVSLLLMIVGAVVVLCKLESNDEEEIPVRYAAKLFTICTLILAIFIVILVMTHIEYNIEIYPIRHNMYY